MRIDARLALTALGLLALGLSMAGCGGGGGGGTPETVTGRVLYGDTDQPAVGVTVQIGTYPAVTTDEEGRFQAPEVVAPKTYTVTVTNVGNDYEEYEAQIRVELGTGDPPIWDMGIIYLAPKPPPGPGI